MKRAFLGICVTLLLFTGCSQKKTIKIAATLVPHAQILEQIKPNLKKEGIHLSIVEMDDYVLPNRLLEEGQVQANFFQHTPFLEMQNKEFGYHLVPLAKVHTEPLGIYSLKFNSLDEIPSESRIGIPSDPSNETRALHFLEELGWISLKEGESTALMTPLDIVKNEKRLRFIEMDAGFLPRTLEDLEFALIPMNFAIQASLHKKNPALAYEIDCDQYCNIVAIRENDLEKPEFLLLKKLLQSENIKIFLKEQYGDSVYPSF